MNNTPLLNLALATFLAIALGWILVVGKSILLPILAAVIAVYIMLSATDALQRLKVFRRVPPAVVKFLVLLIFTVLLVSLAVLVAATVREIASVAPEYEQNLDSFLERVAQRFELDRQEIWDEIRAVTIDAFDLHAIVLLAFSGFTNVSGTIFLIVIYAAFLMGERAGFESKVLAAFPTGEQGQKTLGILREMNLKVSDYLVAKTMINILLALLSFVILWLYGVDFALFWAIVIGLLNYIPYIGSYLGVIFPVVLSFAQFVSWPLTLSLAVFLTIAQFVMGNLVEPRFIGRQVNLSPVVVLVSLSVWMTLWGVPGAILAVPLTSVMAIVFASFNETRFLSVLLAHKIDD